MGHGLDLAHQILRICLIFFLPDNLSFNNINTEKRRALGAGKAEWKKRSLASLESILGVFKVSELEKFRLRNVP